MNLGQQVCKPLRREKQIFQRDVQSLLSLIFSVMSCLGQRHAHGESRQAPGGQTLSLIHPRSSQEKQKDISPSPAPVGWRLFTSFSSTSSLHCASESGRGIFLRGLLVWLPGFNKGAKNNKHLVHLDPKKLSDLAQGHTATKQQSCCQNPDQCGSDPCSSLLHTIFASQSTSV